MDTADGDKGNAPVKGAMSYTSSGKTIYTKAVVYLVDPPDDEKNRFHGYPISDLTIAPRFFTEDLTKTRRHQDIKVGIWEGEADRFVRLFAKIQKCKLLNTLYSLIKNLTN